MGGFDRATCGKRQAAAPHDCHNRRLSDSSLMGKWFNFFCLVFFWGCFYSDCSCGGFQRIRCCALWPGSLVPCLDPFSLFLFDLDGSFLALIPSGASFSVSVSLAF